jgi:hypothetical protein
MVSLEKRGGAVMESADLAMLIVGGIGGLGVIGLGTWIVATIRCPGWDFLRPELVKGVCLQPRGASGSQGNNSVVDVSK